MIRSLSSWRKAQASRNGKSGVDECISWGQSNEQCEVGPGIPEFRDQQLMVIPRRRSVARNRTMRSTSEEIEEVVRPFPAVDAIAAHVFGFIKDQRQSPVAKGAADLISTTRWNT